MTEKRPMGSLESEVLHVLWSSDGPVTPGEVLDGIGGELAYTTVMTILTRLWSKGLVTREREGRAFAYSTTVTEADHAAQKMRNTLADVTDRHAALSRFVRGLSKKDAVALRKLLDDKGDR